MMHISETEQNGVCVFALQGRADSDGTPELEAILGAAVRTGKTHMILELSEVTYMNSAALRVLADVLATNRDKGGDLFLVALAPRVHRVFEIIGFHNFFQIFEDIDTALQAFAGASR